MEQIPKLDFETLDTILGDHAPFLISMPDWLQEELRLVIAAAETRACLKKGGDCAKATK